MAGHRRPSKTNPTGRPVQKTLREQRRLGALEERLDAAKTPADRIGAAAAYLRSVIGYAAPAVAEAIADQVVEDMKAAGHAAYEDRPIPARRRSSRRTA